MDNFADQSRSQMGDVVQITVSFVRPCRPACRVLSGGLTHLKNVNFYADMSGLKLVWLFCCCLKFVRKGARAFLSLAVVVVGFLSLVGCQFGEPKHVGSDLDGVNHTWDAINRFAVNGYGGKNIQPNGFGSGACCVVLPRKWPPGLKVRVDWEVDPNPRASLPPLWSNEYKAAYEKHSAGYRRYSAIVDIPEYKIEGLCNLAIHFLPCKKIKATTACAIYGSPGYPIKEPQKMKEPQVCPE